MTFGVIGMVKELVNPKSVVPQNVVGQTIARAMIFGIMIMIMIMRGTAAFHLSPVLRQGGRIKKDPVVKPGRAKKNRSLRKANSEADGYTVVIAVSCLAAFGFAGSLPCDTSRSS